ncbi:MAG: ribonucleoside triphosphate reductase [Candidatus Hadarchaeaceae archaeon]
MPKKAKLKKRKVRAAKKVKPEYIDAAKFVDDYIGMQDWRVKENANVAYSFSSLFLHAAGETVARYALSKVYPREIARAHIEGDFHIHNVPFGIVGYCAGWSIKDLLLQGFSGVAGRTESSPARHFSSALLQISNFLGSVQNEWAGAQAVNSLDIYLAPFVRKDGLSYKQVKQAMQEFIYNLNISSRWGGQTPFTNLALELKVPEDMKEQPVIYGGKVLDETYADFQPEADLVNRAFLDVMLHGDMRGRIFTFPIPTYNVTKDFEWDSEISDLLFQATAKFGIPYFQNCIKGGINPREVRAMCCRLQLDLRELHRRYGGFFGYAEKTGSVGVVTVNMPRLGYSSKDEGKFFERLGRLMELAKDSLEIKRELVGKNMERGLLPFSARYLGTLKFHFSTIGLVGMHEACRNFLGEGIETKGGKEFAIKVLKFMRKKLLEFQEETGNIYNLEATPAEGTSHRLARLDKKHYPKIITSGKKVPYYTNSTNLPVGYTNDLVEALRHQDDLQVLYNGGTVFHSFLGEAVSSAEGCKVLVRKIAENFRLPYYTITPTFSICMEHGYLRGAHFKCPSCGKPAEVYSRIVGYFRPVQNWHVGKQEEFYDRIEYDEKVSMKEI